MVSKLRSFLAIAAISLIPTFVIWLPFFLRVNKLWSIPLPQNGMATIVSNYDGPLFLIVSKTFYNQHLIKANFQIPLPTEYYAAHFPLYPFLIKTFSFLFGYPYSMLFVTLASSILAIYFFNKMIKEYIDERFSLWITLIFSLFPARWLIVRSVGSAEPLFIASMIASIYFFSKRKYLLAGVWGALAQLTKSPGIILFLSFFLSITLPHLKRIINISFPKWIKNLELSKTYPIFFIPLSLFFVFFIYKITFNDFFAYFKSGDNIHLFFPPFQIFNYSAPWVGTFWLEEVIFVYLIGALGLVRLIKMYKKQILKSNIIPIFTGIYFLSTLFVAHRDIIRYSLPIVPFLFLGFSKTLLKKEFKYIFFFLVISVYLFSIAYISQNTMPISDWAPFL